MQRACMLDDCTVVFGNHRRASIIVVCGCVDYNVPMSWSALLSCAIRASVPAQPYYPMIK